MEAAQKPVVVLCLQMLHVHGLLQVWSCSAAQRQAPGHFAARWPERTMEHRGLFVRHQAVTQAEAH